MTALTGTGPLIRLILRRDRVRILVWTVGITALVLAVASSIQDLYPTQPELESAAADLAGNAAQIALNGPDRGLDTIGGRVTFEVWNFGLITIALMSLLMVARHTRAEEEAGRTELIRSAPVGRHAPSAAALTIVAAMNLLVGAAVALGLTAQGLPAAGSVALGAAFTAAGLVFAAIALVAAQLTDNTRVASGLAGAALAVAFALRAIGDVGDVGDGDGTLSWTSPLGWAQASRPFAGERWWPIAIALAATVGLVAVAGAVGAHRDVGAGLVPPRPGPTVASPRLAGPVGLALRLGRGSLIAWTIGVFLGGLALGSIGPDVDDLVGDSQEFREVLAQPGSGNLTDSFLATFLLLMALIGTGYALQAAQRLRSEETAGRAEPVLATPVSRQRWATSHLAVALAGGVVVLAAAGLGTGLAYGIGTGDLGQVPRLVGAALAYTPAVWALVGLAAALFGLAPQALTAVWAGLALCLTVGLLGQLLDPPAWLTDLSPFQHIPRLPAADPTSRPLLILTAIAAGLTTTGITAFRQRDLG